MGRQKKSEAILKAINPPPDIAPVRDEGFHATVQREYLLSSSISGLIRALHGRYPLRPAEEILSEVELIDSEIESAVRAFGNETLMKEVMRTVEASRQRQRDIRGAHDDLKAATQCMDLDYIKEERNEENFRIQLLSKHMGDSGKNKGGKSSGSIDDFFEKMLADAASDSKSTEEEPDYEALIHRATMDSSGMGVEDLIDE